jgi:hypothetical protein
MPFETASYRLFSASGQGTTGAAQWRLGANPVRGMLDVKLGGKNITFHQRITARRSGECVSGAK